MQQMKKTSESFQLIRPVLLPQARIPSPRSVTLTLQDGPVLTVSSLAVPVDLCPLSHPLCSPYPPSVDAARPENQTSSSLSPRRERCILSTTTFPTTLPLITQGIVLLARPSSYVDTSIIPYIQTRPEVPPTAPQEAHVPQYGL